MYLRIATDLPLLAMSAILCRSLKVCLFYLILSVSLNECNLYIKIYSPSQNIILNYYTALVLLYASTALSINVFSFYVTLSDSHKVCNH